MSLIKNNINLPDYLDVRFFEKSLKNGLKCDDIKISSVNFAIGSKPGENFCSIVYIAQIDYTRNESEIKTIKLLVKSIAQNIMTPILKEVKMFQHESDIYLTILSKITKILGGEKITPEYFYNTDDPIDTVVLEYLNEYKTADRVKGLDEVHCALVLQKLAKLHAASMVIAQKYPAIPARFSDDIVKNRRNKVPALRNSLMLSFKCLAKVASAWSGFEVTAKKFERFAETAADNYVQWHGSMENELKVLAHNDLWVNNILFKYNNNIPINLNFVDFQVSFYSSPGIDLTHFLYTSLEYQLLEQKRDFIIAEYYYKTLKAALEKLNYKPIPSLEEIDAEIDKREIGAFVWSIIKLHVIFMDNDKSKDNNFDSLANNDSGMRIRELGMSSEHYVSTMKYIFKRMEKLEILK